MSVEGRISVDVLFHDKDGTNAVNVVELSKTAGYTSGKVAIVSGVCGTNATSLSTDPSTYRGIDGNYVSFSTVERVAFSSEYTCVLQNNEEFGESIVSRNGSVAVSEILTFSDSLSVYKATYVLGEPETSSYTLVIYGT